MRYWTDLSVGQLEDQLDLVTIDNLLLDLGGNPALGGIGLPGLGADIVGRCHGGLVLWRCVVRRESKAYGHPSVSAERRVQSRLQIDVESK